MAVSSKSLPDAPAAPQSRVAVSPMWPLGIVALALGSILWLISARYTLAGWVAGLNLALTLLQLPARVPLPIGWWWLLAIPVGMVYSLVELRINPGPPPTWAQLPIWCLAVGLIVFVHATDIGSTVLGYVALPPNPWPIHVWAVGNGWWALGLWSILLTYIPERAILWGWRWLMPYRR